MMNSLTTGIFNNFHSVFSYTVEAYQMDVDVEFNEFTIINTN
jgi:hypothetical protein